MNTSAGHRALIGWRLLALLYDLLPVASLWLLVAAIFTVAHGEVIRGGALGNLEFAALWLVTGIYATVSWRRGGRTLGMRPWKLEVTAADGSPATWRALWLRYAIGTLSLLLAGTGFCSAWLDPRGLTWHDRLSGTRIRRH